MLKPVENTPRQARLADMGVVRVQGADAVKFLQGQLSNDVSRVSADRSVLAGLHNPQGRAIALLRLVLAGPDEILALVPRELAAPVAARLGKFVLRAKVKTADVSAEWDVVGVQLGGITGGFAAASVGAARHDEEGRLWVCVATDDTAAATPMSAEPPGAADVPSGTDTRPVSRAGSAAATTSRWLVASRAAAQPAEPDGAEAAASPDVGSPIPSMTRDEWRALDIASGIPQVYAATSESFVAQMLNLDFVDGIAFDKGCYTGQEVIARAHYRGKVKRRMQRFRTREPAKLNASEAGTLNDGRSFKIVDAVQLSDGRCEFLAVTTFGEGGDDAEASAAASGATASSAAPSPAAASSENTAMLNAEPLPLPYSLPV